MQKHWRVAFFGTLVLAAVVTGLSAYRYRLSSPPATLRPQHSTEEIRRTWEVGVSDVVRSYTQDGNAVQARDRLLALTVPVDKREQHLALVLALEAEIQGRADADTRWQRAMELLSRL